MYGFPHGSVLGSLLFLIYINDLPDGINSLCKIFADDTSLTYISLYVYDMHKSASKPNDGLEKISYRAYQWKMQLNPNQANDVFLLKMKFK